jgi:osmoprotectant transport system permease protein
MRWALNHVPALLDVSEQHLRFALVPVLLGLVISVPLGWVANRWPVARAVLVPVAGLLYTIPSLALFVVMPVLLGTQVLDPINVQAALTVYTVALLVRSVADALAAVPQHITAAATAMGFRPLRRFATVELPLAVPVLVSGLRVSTVTNISLVSVGSLIGVGGLGQFIVEGFQRDNSPEIVTAVLLIIVLALVFDGLLVLLGRRLTPWQRAGRAGATA